MSNSTPKATSQEKVADSKTLYLRLFAYAWKYKEVFLIGILGLVFLSATNTAFLATIKQVTDEGFVKQSPDKMALLPLMLFGLMAVRGLSGFFSGFAMRWVARRVVIGVPSGITNVERRAVRDAAKNAGAREVYIVEEPMSAAIGIGLPIKDPIGSMVVDIGGGTTDVAVISLGGIVHSRNIKIAGDKLNNDIISYLRNEFKILIGEKTAEDIKINIGNVFRGDSPLEMPVRGRDLITGLPREVVVTDNDVKEAIGLSIDTLIESIKEVIEITPPEVVSDVMYKGIYLVGGGALLRGLKELFEDSLKIPIHVAGDPLTAVVRGAGVILTDVDSFEDALIENEDELPFIQ